MFHVCHYEKLSEVSQKGRDRGMDITQGDNGVNTRSVGTDRVCSTAHNSSPRKATRARARKVPQLLKVLQGH